MLATIGSQVGVAVENVRVYENTLELAQMDGLTGIANRRYMYMMERLEREIDRASRYHTSLSVIFQDLDKFKSFNDTYWHVKGDELLKAFASMLKKEIRAAGLAAGTAARNFALSCRTRPLKALRSLPSVSGRQWRS